MVSEPAQLPAGAQHLANADQNELQRMREVAIWWQRYGTEARKLINEFVADPQTNPALRAKAQAWLERTIKDVGQ